MLLLVLLLALAPPAAAQVALGGVMRFATADVAFHGGFGGVAVEVWGVEPYGYLSPDAGVWAIQAGVASPIVRRETVRVSVRLGTSTAIAGPAVEPDVHLTVGPACASDGASACWPRWTARRRSRCCAPACSSAGEGLSPCPRSPGGCSPSRTPSGSSRRSTGIS